MILHCKSLLSSVDKDMQNPVRFTISLDINNELSKFVSAMYSIDIVR